jgi:hypothetical protein
MTTIDRFDPFERRIGEALDSLAPLRRPAYLDDILQHTARTRQRPRRTFLERWLPMASATRPSVLADGVPLRPLLLLGLVALLLATVAVIGSRLLNQPSLTVPAPYGPARNGLVAYSVDHDVYLGDPAAGGSRLLAEGAGYGPIFEPMGNRIASHRNDMVGNGPCYGPQPAAVCTVSILLTDISGTSSMITPAPLPWPARVRDWSADGLWLLLTDSEDHLLLLATDGSGTRDVSAVSNQFVARFAPPATTSIWTDERNADGLRPIRIGLDGRVLDRFPGLPAHHNLAFDASWDGRRFAVGGDGSVVSVVRLDGSVVETVDLGQDVTQVLALAWSPDASLLLVETLWGADRRVGLVPLADAATLRWLDPPAVETCGWSPDGASLLCSDGEAGWWRVPLNGPSVNLGWLGAEMSYRPSWQRLPVQVAP